MKVLDHGYLNVIGTWGSDEQIVEAARMSTDKGFLGWGPECKECRCNTFDERAKVDAPCPACGTSLVAGDEKLLRYLWENKHASPFEMGGMTIEVMAPIFVFREWHRHRTQSYNEMSARYIPLPDLSYVPNVERLMLNSKTNKQVGTIKNATELSEVVAADLMVEEREFNAAAERFYQKKLASGVPKELARTHLGVSRYSRMRASANLRNWLAFLTLRNDSHAQWEIRQYAITLQAFLVEAFPRTLALFTEGQK